MFIKKFYNKNFYSQDNDKMEHSDAKLFIEDDLNDDFNKNYVKCNCLKNNCILHNFYLNQHFNHLL